MYLKRGVSAFLLVLAVGLSGCTVNVPVIDQDTAYKSGEQRLSRVKEEQTYQHAQLDLPAAVSRALLFNLDYQAAFMSANMARADLARSHYLLWPQLAAGAGYSARNSYSMAKSFDPLSNTQTLQASTSSERQGETAQLQITWNALDFGVGYLRAKQKGNAALIAEEQRRKAIQVITQDVTLAWWRGVAVQELEPRLKELREHIESALERSREIERLRLQTAYPILDYRRDLLLSLKRISALEKDMRSARRDLARLVAVPEGEKMVLGSANNALTPSWLPASLSREQMRRIVLANRPELREMNYRQRMAALEGKVAVASLFPSLGLSAGLRYDSNKFLSNNDWKDVNASASFNLLGLAALPANRRYAKTVAEAESLRADAMTVAVLSQLDVALQAISSDQKGLCLSREIDSIARERERQQKARSASASGDELSLIRSQVESALASIESAFSRADMEASQAMLLNTLGVDPYPQNLSNEDYAAVEEQLRAWFETGLREYLQKEAAKLGGEGEPALQPFESVCSL